MEEQVYALVVCPHPDDGEFGIAGTAAHWVQEGKDVVYVICTNGDKGSSDVEMTSEKLAETREKEQLAAAEVLGIKKVEFLRYPDQGLEDTPQFRKDLVRLIRKYRPEVVATNDPYRRYMYHRDHRITGTVTLDAIFPYARDYLAYPDLIREGLQPHKVKEILLWASSDVNYRVDITATFELKLAAIRCHVSQFGARLPQMEEMMRQRHHEMANGQSFELAEGFHREQILR